MNPSTSKTSNLRKPVFRKLRGYAFDPSLSLKIDTAAINQLVYQVEWEDLRPGEAEYGSGNPPPGPGPVGEYLEVIDYDPTVKQFYAPVDLNDPYILAQDGLEPSESNPQFHQQMVYAVAMTTIKNFERALGRKILWAPRQLRGKRYFEEYVQRLRIYPHALRDANAYYSPVKKALLFGYFAARPADGTAQMPDSLVFTCLSHDIIAHETTHAILDGMHRYYNEPTNPDVLAFHEAFADIVALFQHFTFPEVLRQQVAKTRGDLSSENLLGQLAQQFGSAVGSYGSLRDALGSVDPQTKKWTPKTPDPGEYQTVLVPHHRGSILVAAVFEAFTTIYKNRVADLMRIASNGTGILQQGELHPDLVNRLASEAAKAAGHVLSMCIRALDYCPPVDITFGDYLRAIITADLDLVAADPRHYRLAFIDAFRRRGIYPEGIKTLSVESLRYPLNPSAGMMTATQDLIKIISGFLREYRGKVIYLTDRRRIYLTGKKYITGTRKKRTGAYASQSPQPAPGPDGTPHQKGEHEQEEILGLHNRIFSKFENSVEFEQLTGLAFYPGWSNLGVPDSHAYKDESPGPSFQVQNLRLVSRVGPNSNQINQIVFSLVQRCGVIINKGKYAGPYVPKNKEKAPDGGFEFRGGCTMIFDLDTLKLKYAISKPLLDLEQLRAGKWRVNTRRFEQQYRYQSDADLMGMSEYSKYFGLGLGAIATEPFALLHQH